MSVLVSGLVIKFGEAWGPRRFLADPLASLLIVLILLRGAVPLVRQCVRRLLAEPEEPEPEPEPEPELARAQAQARARVRARARARR